MKKIFTLRKRAALFLILFVLTGINSCIKGSKQVIFLNNTSGTVTDILLSRMADKDKVHPAEISTWLNANFPAANLPLLQMDKAQQNVIKGQHVVRIPMAANAAMFFTKDKGVLQSYIYKWQDKAPGQQQFTGTIFSYAFKSNTIQQISYDHSVVTLTNYYSPPSKQTAMGNTKLKLNDGDIDFFDFFLKFLCWLRGGEFKVINANGNVLQKGCDMTNAPTGGGSGNNDGPVISPGFFGNPNITAADLGSNGSNGAGYGNGYVWVSTYVPPSDGCSAGAGDGLSQPDPGDGDCILGHWENFQTGIIDDPANSDPDFNLSQYVDISSIDNNLSDVSVMPNYTGASLDDNINSDFDPLVDANFVDITIDPSFSSNAQLNRVYTTMQTNFTVQKALAKFFGKKNPVNLEFRAQVLGPLTRGETISIGDPSNPYSNRIIIEIDPTKASNRPDLMVVKTIIHEIIHAEIFRLIHLSNQHILPTEYNKIINAMLAYLKTYPKANPKVNAYWDHGYMAQHYLSTIAKALQEYDNNPTVPLCFYKMLAWEGLEYTPYYNKMSTTDIQKITDAINNYVSSQIISTCIN